MQNAPGFVQKPCVKCGANVYIAEATGTGYCPQCQTMNSTGAAAPAGSPAAAFQAAAAGGGGLPIAKILPAVGGAILVAALGIGGTVVKSKFGGGGGGGKNSSSLSSIGINDVKKADADAMVTAVRGLATKWKSDAVWLGLNYQAVSTDGTIDLSNGGAQVDYISPSAAKNMSKSVYSDSVKEFAFGPSGVTYNRISGVVDPKSWQDYKTMPTPGCTIKQLMQTLQKTKGVKPGGTVRVTYDIQFQQAAPKELSWRVLSEDPKFDNYFSMSNCAQTK